jgi:hypothetical protein
LPIPAQGNALGKESCEISRTLKEFANVSSRRKLHCVQFGAFSENSDIHPETQRDDGDAPVVRYIDRRDRDVIGSPKMRHNHFANEISYTMVKPLLSTRKKSV